MVCSMTCPSCETEMENGKSCPVCGWFTGVFKC